MKLDPVARWRLVLGEAASCTLGGGRPREAGSCTGGGGGAGQEGEPAEILAMDAALEWLYGRDAGFADRDERRGGSGGSTLTVPAWINEIHRVFPKETIERLERDAVERYRIDEVVTNPEVLARVEPDQALVEAVMRTKQLMNPAVLALAKQMVAKVVKRLMDALATEVKAAFSGAIDRRRRTSLKVARNLDFRRTLKDNLRHWSPATRRLYLARPVFFSRTGRHADRWQLILVVDQSGSMVGSVIHAAVTAACFWNLPGITTHLVAFDTSVVDLTRDVDDPVELLMRVQLGGGTDIAKAMRYALDLVTTPRRAIVVLITDFYERGSAQSLVRTVEELCAQGSKVLGLAALDAEANPTFDRELAQRLVDVGAHVAAMTPGQLAQWIAQKVRA